MRLIDADAIPYTMLYKEDWLRGTGVEKQAVWKDTIDAMPTFEAEPVRRGKWKRIKVYPDLVFCDECGEPFKNNPNEKWNYCPNCGVKMEVEE